MGKHKTLCLFVSEWVKNGEKKTIVFFLFFAIFCCWHGPSRDVVFRLYFSCCWCAFCPLSSLFFANLLCFRVLLQSMLCLVCSRPSSFFSEKHYENNRGNFATQQTHIVPHSQFSPHSENVYVWKLFVHNILCRCRCRYAMSGLDMNRNVWFIFCWHFLVVFFPVFPISCLSIFFVIYAHCTHKENCQKSKISFWNSKKWALHLLLLRSLSGYCCWWSCSFIRTGTQ